MAELHLQRFAPLNLFIKEFPCQLHLPCQVEHVLSSLGQWRFECIVGVLLSRLQSPNSQFRRAELVGEQRYYGSCFIPFFGVLRKRDNSNKKMKIPKLDLKLGLSLKKIPGLEIKLGFFWKRFQDLRSSWDSLKEKKITSLFSRRTSTNHKYKFNNFFIN